ncbi:AAA family ATPase [Dialister succinatiphilus]|uniref:AAA family ATPase n=1 Tax=Dialister succinatiphilus TaxID=487173 RepID=UPI002355E110|nr:AAA family ATPase [Dialister succinatiphilus]
MKLVIENIGKIKKAEFDFRGITVIAGNNNTGKSTVGKVLYSFFNSLQNVSEKVENQRYEERCDALQAYMTNEIYSSFEPSDESNRIRRIFSALKFKIPEDLDLRDKSEVKKWVASALKKRGIKLSDRSAGFSKLWKQFENIDKIDDKDIISVLVERYYKDVFHNQINSLFVDAAGKVRLDIQSKEFILEFKHNKVTSQNIPFDIRNRAIFIQSPDIIDALGEKNSFAHGFVAELMNGLNEQLILSLIKRTRKNAIAETQFREKMTNITALLNEVIPGEFDKKSSGNVVYNEKEFEEPLSVINLSTGLKSFALLQLLLDNSALGDKDVLILDEPEVNLHPGWQLKYAELIVLLERAFNLTVLLTTHSPYFLRAIEMYSRKYGITNDCDYYLASLTGNNEAEFFHVNDQLNRIYREMAEPFEVLNHIDDNLEN